jgi:histidine triad (HIT) family protein
MSDCIFCKIVAGEIPADKLYEDERTLAIVDIMPTSLGHALVLPKEHHASLLETPDELAAAMLTTAKRVAAASMKALNAPAFNLGVNTGAAAGQIVMHTHFHVMPRHEGDGLVHWPKLDLTKKQMADAAAKVRAALAA